MRFEMNFPNRILFAPGAVSEIGPALRSMGRRVIVLLGEKGADPDPILRVANNEGLDYLLLPLKGEPTLQVVEHLIQKSQEFYPDFVLAFGGGSVIDAGKALSVLSINPGPVMDYLEVIGTGKTLSLPGLPLVAIPTTAGTGAEVTRNAVIGVPEQRIKVSLRSPFMLPRLAVIDPQVTYDLPPTVTASTGMDALTQVIEPFVSLKANPMTDLYCREGMFRIRRSLKKAFEDGSNQQARLDMSFGALLGGLALANAGLGAVHGFAGPIGGMFNVPHGVVCARLLPAVVEANYNALKQSTSNAAVLTRFTETSQILTGRPESTPEDLVRWLTELCESLGIPRLREFNINAGDFDDICDKALTASSMKANPVLLEKNTLIEILQQAW
jgi:alcohol dehydrogenase class IV